MNSNQSEIQNLSTLDLIQSLADAKKNSGENGHEKFGDLAILVRQKTAKGILNEILWRHLKLEDGSESGKKIDSLTQSQISSFLETGEVKIDKKKVFTAKTILSGFLQRDEIQPELAEDPVFRGAFAEALQESLNEMEEAEVIQAFKAMFREILEQVEDALASSGEMQIEINKISVQAKVAHVFHQNPETAHEYEQYYLLENSNFLKRMTVFLQNIGKGMKAEFLDRMRNLGKVVNSTKQEKVAFGNAKTPHLITTAVGIIYGAFIDSAAKQLSNLTGIEWLEKVSLGGQFLDSTALGNAFIGTLLLAYRGFDFSKKMASDILTFGGVILTATAMGAHLGAMFEGDSNSFSSILFFHMIALSFYLSANLSDSDSAADFSTIHWPDSISRIVAQLKAMKSPNGLRHTDLAREFEEILMQFKNPKQMQEDLHEFYEKALVIFRNLGDYNINLLNKAFLESIEFSRTGELNVPGANPNNKTRGRYQSGIGGLRQRVFHRK